MTRACLSLAALLAGLGSASAQSPAGKVPVVAVVGCLVAQGPDWMLQRATDPVPSIANGPPAGEALKGPTVGKNQYRLIGVSEFDLPSHKGHTVLVKGLFVTAKPVSRVNVTSVTPVSSSCAPAPE
jgi:hypothetical protein